ncbi:MAG: PIN domain-containing protein [Pirellulales bacterium]
MTRVIDASTVLAVCRQETGMQEARLLMRSGLISAVNLHEVLMKSQSDNKREHAESIVRLAGLRVVGFDETQARLATDIAEKTRGMNLSLADRACLSLGRSRNLPIVSGDRLWAELDVGVEVILFRAAQPKKL